jgi:dTDP-4-amino-4,6-dideoxygalactose transaminase
MINLIPRDLWQYNLNDFFSSLFSVCETVRNDSSQMLIKNVGDCLTICSGRAALTIALKVLGLPDGARIGVPLFCCPVVFEAIRLAGAKPVFIDCSRNDFCISIEDLKEKISGLDCLIVVHMFGNSADMDEGMKIASGIPVLEDCAQALGSRYHDIALGNFGSLAIFSFRSGKYISSGEGGGIYTRNQKIYSRCLTTMEGLSEKGRIEETKHVFSIAIKSLLRQKPLYGMLGLRLWSFYNKTVSASREHINLFKVIYSDFKLAQNRLSYLDNMVNKQREIAAFYLKSLKLEREMLCWEKEGSFYNRLYFPITFPSKKVRDKMAEFLFRCGIDTMKYLDGVVEIARRYFGYNGGCPFSEFLSERVLNIPVYYTLKPDEIMKVVHAVNTGWGAYTNMLK